MTSDAQPSLRGASLAPAVFSPFTAGVLLFNEDQT
jgi:hypothetical protein